MRALWKGASHAAAVPAQDPDLAPQSELGHRQASTISLQLMPKHGRSLRLQHLKTVEILSALSMLSHRDVSCCPQAAHSHERALAVPADDEALQSVHPHAIAMPSLSQLSAILAFN